MQINNAKYNVLENAWNIISDLSNACVEDYEYYLSDGNPPDEAFENKLSKLSRLEYDLRKFLQGVDVVG